MSAPFITRCLLAILLVLCGALFMRADDAEMHGDQFRLFFSRRVMIDTKDNGARAAVKAWAQTVIKETGMQAEATAEIGGAAELIAAFREGRVDAASIPADEFFKLAAEAEISDLFLPVSESGPFEEYLLLVHTNSMFTNVAQLRGHKVLLHDHHRMTLAEAWLETALAKDSLGAAESFFSLLQRENKSANVVLPVFFRVSEACIVTRRSFNLAKEMNPQVGAQLRVILSSPPIVPTLFCFNAKSTNSFSMRTRQGIRDLHKTVFGQQVLTTFQVNRMSPGTFDQLESTRVLIQDYEQCLAARQGKTGSGATALNNSSSK